MKKFMAYQIEKLIKENGDKMDGAKKSQAEALIEKIRKAIESKDLVEIESLTKELELVAQELGSAMYGQQGSPAGAGPAPGGQSSGAPSDADVVDVEYDIDEN